MSARTCRALVTLCACSLFLPAASAGDWVHWRGPEQTGQSREVGIPDFFEVGQPGKNGLIWEQPFGGRSAPLVLKGRLYTISGYDMSKPTEGERVMCFDAETGKPLWEKRFNVFHTDIVSSRLGWTTLTADPEKEHIYCHSTAGLVICFDRDGKELWQHSLAEEYGRISGYGGRNASPIFDSGLVIVGMASSGWGEQVRGANRFVAFDGDTGAVVWWCESPYPIKGTYYSNPVIAVINGQRLLISGGGDGYAHAIKVRTGERVWSYRLAEGVVNPSPVVDGNLVYLAHGEENPEGGSLGRVVCVDASQVDPKTKKPKLVWERKDLARRFGLASPALADGRLYLPDDMADLHCFNAKTGKLLWRVKYGTVSRGAPLVVDGKLYIFDVTAKLAVYKLNGDRPPEELESVTFRRAAGPGVVETHGTPIAVNGKLYFLTQDALYCVGDPSVPHPTPQYKPLPPEKPFQATAAPVGIRVFPADVLTHTGDRQKFEVKFLDADGREVNAPADAKVEWSLPQPPLPKTAPPNATRPPALNAKLAVEGNSATAEMGPLPRQQGYVDAKFGTHTARSRVRVAPRIPYHEDFEKTPVGAAPSGWANATGKWLVVEHDGTKVLSKVNTNSRPTTARANAYITAPNASAYTIEADMFGTEVRGRMPDMGLVNSRYTLLLDGKADSPNNKRQVRIVSWEARLRVHQVVEFDWQPGVWYRAKFRVDPDTGTAEAKVWKRGEAEPAEWLISYKDPSPNKEGAAALYAYISDPSISPQQPGSDVFFDNVVITPNAKK